LSLRRKTYLLVGASLLIAAAVVISVALALFVEDGQWTGSVLYFMLTLTGIVMALSVAICAVLEGSMFRKIAKMTAQVEKVGEDGAHLAAIEVRGKDELALLAQTINQAFTELDSTRAEQDEQAQVLAEALEELKGRHADLEAAHLNLQQLQEVSASLGGSLEIGDALGQLEEVALGLFEADEVWLLRLEAEQQQLKGLRSFSNHREGYARLPQVFGCAGPDEALSVEANSLLRTVLRGGGPVFIESITELDRSERDRLFDGAMPDLGAFHSLVVVPLLSEDLPAGLAVSASVVPRRFSSDRKSTILLFASQVAQALENNRLYEEIKALGEIDSLTGLHNRRRALEQLDVEVARARRYEGTFSILLADIDNFKLFNDTYGHPAGDEVINRVATLLHNRNRSSDFVGRFGGDEFILILPATYRAGAATVADHMRLALGSQPFIAPTGAPIPLRLSFGAASYPEDGHDATALIAIADANLYESKRWGGDTVTLRREPIGGETIDASGFSTLDALVSAVDNKDHYTRRHSAHVAEQAAAIVKCLGFSKERQDVLRVAALLHDVGKIGLPDRILRKPGALTSEEEEAVRQHSLLGSLMISQHLPELDEVREAVVSHHERWNGMGYPAQLSGRNIPLLGRILAVADAYSAMITDRPYRAGLSREQAIEELTKGSGTQFDPEVVRVFLTCFEGGQNPQVEQRIVVRGASEPHPV
jgi:diguanylate cyclase (GGDEF)-like protein/putative nucleotidyltransferase with HDIG domain